MGSLHVLPQYVKVLSWHPGRMPIEGGIVSCPQILYHITRPGITEQLPSIKLFIDVSITAGYVIL